MPQTSPPDTVKFATGAVRGTNVLPYRMLQPYVIRRWLDAFAEGAKKYPDYNFLKGLPAGNLYDHLMEHLANWLSGDVTEDHLGHALWNLGELIRITGNPRWSNLWSDLPPDCLEAVRLHNKKYPYPQAMLNHNADLRYPDYQTKEYSDAVKAAHKIGIPHHDPSKPASWEGFSARLGNIRENTQSIEKTLDAAQKLADPPIDRPLKETDWLEHGNELHEHRRNAARLLADITDETGRYISSEAFRTLTNHFLTIEQDIKEAVHYAHVEHMKEEGEEDSVHPEFTLAGSMDTGEKLYKKVHQSNWTQPSDKMPTVMFDTEDPFNTAVVRNRDATIADLKHKLAERENKGQREATCSETLRKMLKESADREVALVDKITTFETIVEPGYQQSLKELREQLAQLTSVRKVLPKPKARKKPTKK